jgi:hypothetical protein
MCFIDRVMISKENVADFVSMPVSLGGVFCS